MCVCVRVSISVCQVCMKERVGCKEYVYAICVLGSVSVCVCVRVSISVFVFCVFGRQSVRVSIKFI